MRSRFRNSRATELRSKRGYRFAAYAAAGAMMLGACGDGAPERAAGTGQVAFAAPDRVLSGPQGLVGQFLVECAFDGFLPDDPIVHPNAAGASHLHQFFGAVGVHADSSYSDLIAADTTCSQQLDTASYWAPALIDQDLNPIEPSRSVAYYRVGPGVDPDVVEAFPANLMMVAGDHTAVEPQALSIVAWSCNAGSVREVEPPDCRRAAQPGAGGLDRGETLRMMVTFQDCWDGEHLRSPIVPEPARHLSYSSAGECPPTHPVHIPQLQFSVEYPAVDPVGLALASGSILSGHADFWNAWDQSKLEREVDACLIRNLPCGIAG